MAVQTSLLIVRPARIGCKRYTAIIIGFSWFVGSADQPIGQIWQSVSLLVFIFCPNSRDLGVGIGFAIGGLGSLRSNGFDGGCQKHQKIPPSILKKEMK